MTGLVAGVAFKAIAGKVASNAVSDAKAVVGFLRAHSIWLTVSLALSLGWGVDHFITHRHSTKVEGQLSAANTALVTSRANETALRIANKKQNTAVTNLGAKSAEQQKAAGKASQVAAGRANEAQATSDRLKQSSRSTGLKSAPDCEPSQALMDQWK